MDPHEKVQSPSSSPAAATPPGKPTPARAEPGWPILDLPGPRPREWGPDLAETGSSHCARLVAEEAMRALGERHGVGVEVRGPWAIDPGPIWADLGYGADLASLDGRHTRWIGPGLAMRSQASALVPAALRALSASGWKGGAIAIPARVWRRDLRDKIHIGEPRQMDVWIFRPGWSPLPEDLLSLVSLAMGACAPAASWSAIPAVHPYTRCGLEVEALWEGSSLEVLECGLASEALLHACGLPGWGGLALGMGLDRMCMLRKGAPDIRLLDDPDPKAARQCSDLAPWRPWSRQPGCSRDVSVAVSAELTGEQVVDAAARAMSRPEWLAGIDVAGRWLPEELPAPAVERLGMSPGQANWLLRVRMRDWRGSIPKAEADEQARRVWDALHEGSSSLYRPGGAP